MLSYVSISVMLGSWRMFVLADRQLWKAPVQGRMSDINVLTRGLTLLSEPTTTIMDIYQSNPEVESHFVWLVVLCCQRHNSEMRPERPSACCDHRVGCGGQTPGITGDRELTGSDKLWGSSWLPPLHWSCIFKFTFLEVMDLYEGRFRKDKRLGLFSVGRNLEMLKTHLRKCLNLFKDTSGYRTVVCSGWSGWFMTETVWW